MVLFAKSALTKACLLSQRAFSTSRSNAFSYMIKEIPIPSKKVPHPEHVKSNLNRVFKNDKKFLNVLNFAKGVSMWRNLFFLAGIPAIVLVNINAFYFEDQHPPRAEFKPFEHMRKRQKVDNNLIII